MGRKICCRCAYIKGSDMKIMVTGATGFVGRHIVHALLVRGHSVIALARDVERAQKMPWFKHVTFVSCDLHKNFDPVLKAEYLPDALVHLAWPGLPNYRDFFHISKNLPADLVFLEAVIKSGVSQLFVAGTCLEYGMQSGPLAADRDTNPTTPYGFAKDSLRKALQLLHLEKPFIFQWMRFFYIHGEGQHRNSLLAQLDRAIDEGHPSFNMSEGNQLRDYLPVEALAKKVVSVLETPTCQGVINGCSGNPISVFELVRQRCKAKGSEIQLNRGYYPYPDYEPFAFWGIPTKISSI